MSVTLTNHAGALKQAASLNSVGSHLLNWIAPGLFAVLVSTTIRLHSWSPVVTLRGVVAALVLVAASIFITMWILGRRLSMPSNIASPLIALGISVAISIALSADPAGSLPRVFLYVALILLGTAIYLLYRDATHIPLESYCVAIAAVHVVFLLDVVLWIKAGSPPFFQESPRLVNFANVRHFGYFGFLAAISGASLAVLVSRLHILWFLLTCCALFGIISMGSRGALLSWITFVILLACFSQARRRVVAQGLAALVATTALVWLLHSSGLLETPNIFVRLETPSTDFSSGRLSIWLESIRAILTHPFFGLGPEGYWLSGCCNPAVLQPHNFILQLLMEFGVVGCAMLSLLAWRGLKRIGEPRRCVRLIMTSQTNLVLACMLAAYLSFCLIDGLLYHALPLMHFAVFCGLFVVGLRQARSAQS